MNIAIKKFKELSKKELYAVLALRCEVFVVEQECAYQDLDGKDEKAYHLLCTENDELLAYLRIFNPRDYVENASIGRVLVKKELRGQGFAIKIMEMAIAFVESKIKVNKIELSAQTYLIEFYESLGFLKDGVEYLEDGIPHIKMSHNISNKKNRKT